MDNLLAFNGAKEVVVLLWLIGDKWYKQLTKRVESP